jgi:hypothetical protein
MCIHHKPAYFNLKFLDKKKQDLVIFLNNNDDKKTQTICFLKKKVQKTFKY